MSVFLTKMPPWRFCLRPVRAAYALPIIHSWRVHILDEAGHSDWVEPYINEFLTFPHGRFDDQVDSLVQLLPWAERRVNPQGNFYSFGVI